MGIACEHEKIVPDGPRDWRCEGCGQSFIPEGRTDLERMTLGELESVGQRMQKAAADIRAAQALFSGNRPFPVFGEPAPPPEHQPQDSTEEDAAAAHRRRQFEPVEAPRPKSLQTDPRARLSAAEIAERQRILGRNAANAVDPNLPEDMQALERT